MVNIHSVNFDHKLINNSNFVLNFPVLSCVLKGKGRKNIPVYDEPTEKITHLPLVADCATVFKLTLPVSKCLFS